MKQMVNGAGLTTEGSALWWGDMDLLPLEAQPPSAAELVVEGGALLCAGLAMLWVALCEWLRERWG